MSQFGGEGTVDVEATRERCFEVAADVEAYPGWHPVIESVVVLEHDSHGRPSRARVVVDASVSTVTVEIAFTYSPPDTVECQRQSGDLREMWTRFEFAELGPERTRLDYATGLDPGRVLSMMARGPVLEKVRRKLVEDAIAGFKRKSESADG
jgi:ribosome-associated toxin RatA of RatAB toxin-antitoxin module